MRRLRSKSGFTLIEVLVVVAIIALLVAILLPSLQRAREMARMAVCKSNMKQLTNGMHLYVTEYGTLPATQSVLYFNEQFWSNGWWNNTVRSKDLRKTNWTWDGCLNDNGGSYGDADLAKFKEDCPRRGTIYKEVKNDQVYVCPSDRVGVPTDTPLGGGGNGRLSYSMSAYLGYKKPERLRRPPSSNGYVLYDPDDPEPSKKVYQSTIWAPSRIFLLVEEHPFYHIGNTREGNFNVTDRIVTRHLPAFRGKDPSTKLKGQTVIAYVDGHVESPWYSWYTTGYKLYREIGFPGEDNNFMKDFVPALPRRK